MAARWHMIYMPIKVRGSLLRINMSGTKDLLVYLSKYYETFKFLRSLISYPSITLMLFPTSDTPLNSMNI